SVLQVTKPSTGVGACSKHNNVARTNIAMDPVRNKHECQSWRVIRAKVTQQRGILTIDNILQYLENDRETLHMVQDLSNVAIYNQISFLLHILSVWDALGNTCWLTTRWETTRVGDDSLT